MNKSFYKNSYINELVGFIEENLPYNLNTKLLSSAGYVSRDKMYRDFYNSSGHSVKEYVRKRRLSNALALIKMSDLPLTDIAFQCGYSSHQSLCRTIKQTLNLTPSEYKSGDTYFFFPPFTEKNIQSVTVSHEILSFSICVLFYNSKLKDIENLAINTFLHLNPNYTGRIFGRNGKQKGDKFCYELYLTDYIPNCEKLLLYGYEITKKSFAYSALFATSTVKNNEEKINTAWDYIFNEWLQTSMFEYTGELYFEEYILRNGKTTKLKLYLPIKKRITETKIKLINNPQLIFVTASAKGFDAEYTASKTVVNYLKEHYLHMLNTINELYFQKKSDTYVCGVRINPKMQLIDNNAINCIQTNQNTYLVLESNVIGDYNYYIELILAHARENGLIADYDGTFAIYNTKDGFNKLKVAMYCPLKSQTI